MRIVVSGGSGFIGRHAVARLAELGHTPVVLDLVGHPSPDVECVIGDIRDPAAVAEAIGPGTGAVVHLAAITSVLLSVNDPDAVFQTNVVGTHLLLERCRELGVGHFVFASTNAVVGNVGATTISERVPLAPLTPYGATKAAAEMLFSAYSASYGLKTVALRYTNVYGAGMQTKDSVIARLMRAALTGGGIQIYGDGEQLRDYLYVSDAVQAIVLGLGLDHSEVVTVGARESVSMNTLHRIACEVTGVAIGAEHIAAKPGEMPAVVVDTSHATALGFAPAYSIREGLAATWEDFRARS